MCAPGVTVGEKECGQHREIDPLNCMRRAVAFIHEKLMSSPFPSPNDPHPLRQPRFLRLDANLSIPLRFFERINCNPPSPSQSHCNTHAPQFESIQPQIPPPESSRSVSLSLGALQLQSHLRPSLLCSASPFIRNPGL
jgi:hypothetical protein